MKTTGIQKSVLKKLGLESNFEITEDLIYKFGVLYSGKEVNLGKPKDIRYTNKLSAMSLVKQKRLDKVPAKDIPEGFIYIISNPAWPGFYKVGYSLESRDRLIQAQTWSPLRDFKIESYYFPLMPERPKQKSIVDWKDLMLMVSGLRLSYLG